MTAIAYKDGLLAADTMAVSGEGLIVSLNRAKIWRNDGILYAAAGSAGVIQKFCQWTRYSGAMGRNVFTTESDCFGAWRIEAHEVWVWNNDEFYRAPADMSFMALGSAREFLEGVLATNCSAEDAISLAIKHRTDAGGSVLSLRLVP